MHVSERTNHVSGDQLLSHLQAIPDDLGSLVSSFPGSVNESENPKWLDNWFLALIEDSTTAKEPIAADTIVQEFLNKSSVGSTSPRSLRLVSIRPNHFRGFRKTDTAINLDGDLVVLEGENSSGKTSLTEALEFLLTGALQRRTNQDNGNSSELERCVQSQLRPADESTWVEGVFRASDGTLVTLRRVLVSDYSAVSTSTCNSTVYIDGVESDEQTADSFIEDHFTADAPILMQHTLRNFVHSTPTVRRKYFERLLMLDEITELINKAVIGKARLSEFPSSTGSVQVEKCSQLIDQIKDSKQIRSAIKSPSQDGIGAALCNTARSELACALPPDLDLAETILAVEAEQSKVRVEQFPFLAKLKPKRAVDDSISEAMSFQSVKESIDSLRVAFEKIAGTELSLQSFGRPEQLFASPFKSLIDEGIVYLDRDVQPCPLCGAADTLSRDRLESLTTIEPLTNALAAGKKDLRDGRNSLDATLVALSKIVTQVIPEFPPQEEWEVEIGKLPSELQATVTKKGDEIRTGVESTIALRTAIAAALATLAEPNLSLKRFEDRVVPNLNTIKSSLHTGLPAATKIAEATKLLETLVGEHASRDAEYALRQLWLDIAGKMAETVSDLNWEQSKVKAQTRLGKVRDRLMEIRQMVLDGQRTAFSEGIADIWNSLRNDRYSRFKDLHIPPPSGKGFPVQIQVRATLDDGKQQVDVDALRVFSESQTNVLGIAAFLTRAALLGQGFVVLDDPVQSMDENHFGTLSGGLLTKLLETGVQVIVLSHNDTFGRKISWAHSDSDGYLTLKLEHSRKNGCTVTERNRRVSERLYRAEKQAEEGKLAEAWLLIRLSLERLYTLVKAKSDPAFDPQTWKDQTAEYMWKSDGVGEIIERTLPGSEKELKKILSSTAAGAHDKQPEGQTDIINAVGYIRRLLTPLRCGD